MYAPTISASVSAFSSSLFCAGVDLADQVPVFFLVDNDSGNQRDRDRERAQARANSKAKQRKNDGLTPEQRRERDAKALQEKAAKKAAGGNNAGGGKTKK